MSGHGISVPVLSGWDVRISRRPAAGPERTHAVLHAGTFPLPEVRGDYGDGAVQVMSRRDVFVALVEFAPSAGGTPLFRQPGLPRSVAAGDFARTALQHAVAGQSGVQRFFSDQGRAWCLYVVVGSHQHRGRLAPRANELLSGVVIEPRVS